MVGYAFQHFAHCYTKFDFVADGTVERKIIEY
jgi:glutathionylspermidine synthase